MCTLCRKGHAGEPRLPGHLPESLGQCRSQQHRWSRTRQRRLLVIQELRGAEDFGEFQGAVPGGVFQHLESRQLCAALALFWLE